MLHNSVLALHLEIQSNRGGRRECKAVTKNQITVKICWKNSINFLIINHTDLSLNKQKSQENKLFKAFFM